MKDSVGKKKKEDKIRVKEQENQTRESWTTYEDGTNQMFNKPNKKKKNEMFQNKIHLLFHILK